ncbi:MAG: transcriptional regulator GutM [Thermoanaerobacteraceae bacterium]
MNFRALLLIIAGMWILQSILTYFQIKNYYVISNELSKKGNLVVGTKKGYLSSGCIIIMAVDSDYKVVDCMILSGITVLSRFHRVDKIINKNLFDKNNIKLFNKSEKIAFKKAIDNISLEYVTTDQTA